MPTPTKAESLVGIVEAQDGAAPLDPAQTPVSTVGPALTIRRQQLENFPPLGPPDMLYLRKRYVPVVGSPKLYGYYHFVRGVAPLSVASISAYIVDVVRNNGLDAQTWIAPAAWEIVSATFVSYNLMARADLVVHVDFPGSTSANAYDAQASSVPLNDLFWHQLHVSSFIRDFSSHGEQPSYPALRVISPASSVREHAFLDSAVQCVQTWHLSNPHSPENPCIVPAKSTVAIIIRDHFLNFSRYTSALQFFSSSRVLETDPLCAVHAASAARHMRDLDKASSIISSVLEKAPTSDIALMELAHIHRTRGNLPEALDVAKKASLHASGDVMFWTSVADLHADLKQHNDALYALNRAEMPPPTIDPYLHYLLRLRNNETTPVEGFSKGYDAVRVFSRRLRDEKNMTNDKTDESLYELPAKLMQDVDFACYRVLVKLLNDLSWDNLLVVRGKCFVMETDIENGDVPDDEETDVDSKDLSDDQQEPPPENGDIPSDSTTNGLANVSLDDNEETSANGEDEDESFNERKQTLEKGGKKVCKPWLDYLVTNMYQDLRAMAFWTAEEQHMATAAALAAAAVAKKSQGDLNTSTSNAEDEADVESQVAEEPMKRTAEDIASTTNRPSADWLRRGDLALRLGKLGEAKDAFSVCIIVSKKEKKVSISALSRLMSLASKDGDIKTTLRCADEVWGFLDASTDRKPSSEPSFAVADVRKAIFKLIAEKGLRRVRETLTESGMDLDKKRMEGLLLDAVALQVDGFSR